MNNQQHLDMEKNVQINDDETVLVGATAADQKNPNMGNLESITSSLVDLLQIMKDREENIKQREELQMQRLVDIERNTSQQFKLFADFISQNKTEINSDRVVDSLQVSTPISGTRQKEYGNTPHRDFIEPHTNNLASGLGFEKEISVINHFQESRGQSNIKQGSVSTKDDCRQQRQSFQSQREEAVTSEDNMWYRTPYGSGQEGGSLSARSRYSDQGRNNFSGPQSKLPTYDGEEDIQAFLIPFERIAARYQWDDQEKIDRLYECLRGKAVNYLCNLPHELTGSFEDLKGQLKNRFGRKDLPSTARRRLTNLQQGTMSNDEFAEEVRKIVNLAYPGITFEMRDQLAAETFLQGHANKRVAYEVLNRNPYSLNEAINQIELLQSNYQITVGRDQNTYTRTFRDRTRRVSWADEESDTEIDATTNINRLRNNSYTNFDDLERRVKLLEKQVSELKTKATYQSNSRKEERSQSPSRNCYICGEVGHFMKDCTRSRSPSPSEKRGRSADPMKVFRIGKESNSISIPIMVNNLGTTAIVDTGADATVLSFDFAEKAELNLKNSFEATLMNAEDGSTMKAVGGVTATFSIGKKKIDFSVYIAPIRDPVLLGMDFLQEADVTVLARKGDLLVGKELVVGNSDDTVMVKLKSEEVFPPNCQRIIIGRVALEENCELSDAVLEPASNPDINPELLIDASLVHNSKEIHVRVIYLGTKEFEFPKDTYFGKLVEVESVPEPPEQSCSTLSASTHESNPLPTATHAQTLFNEASETLDKEKFTLGNVLDVFAREDDDYSCFTALKHKINTSSASPIRQPVGFQYEEKDHLDALLKEGTVRASSSEWASPVALVRKKNGAVRWRINYRKVNAHTVKDAYPLPKTEECLDTLSGSVVSSILDLLSGFHQIKSTDYTKDQNTDSSTLSQAAPPPGKTDILTKSDGPQRNIYTNDNTGADVANDSDKGTCQAFTDHKAESGEPQRNTCSSRNTNGNVATDINEGMNYETNNNVLGLGEPQRNTCSNKDSTDPCETYTDAITEPDDPQRITHSGCKVVLPKPFA